MWEYIYKQMQEGKWYTAAELDAAPASMTALVRRGLVEKTETSPRQYRKLVNTLFSRIADIKRGYSNNEYFTLYKTDRALGMMCRIKDGKVLDCYDKMYPLDNVYKMQVGKDIYTF